MSIKNLMTPAFRKAEGGLFTKVTKADAGVDIEALLAEGYTILSWADPFFPDPSTPEFVLDATVEALKSGVCNHYTSPLGSTELKEVIAEKLKQYNGLTVDPKRNILITPGSDSGLFFAMYAFIEHGDEVLIPDPCYPNNFQNVETRGGVLVPVPLRAENGFQPVAVEFEARITEKTKMLVLTNPNNPTTTVFSRENMLALAEMCIKHNLVCVVDQAFEDIIFDGREMVTMAALPGMWERTVTVFSVSKGMGLSGYRVGYIVADDVVMDALYGTAVSVIGAANTAAQKAVAEALRRPEFVQEYAAIFDRRRHKIMEILKDVPGIKTWLPESGFLIWIDVSALGSSAEVCDYLFKHAKVSVNDGTAYGAQGKGHIRIVFGCLRDDEKLYEAFRRIAKAFTELAKEKGIC